MDPDPAHVQLVTVSIAEAPMAKPIDVSQDMILETILALRAETLATPTGIRSTASSAPPDLSQLSLNAFLLHEHSA